MSSIHDTTVEEFIDLISQAVIDKLEQRSQINQLADLVIARVTELQQQQIHLQQSEQNGKA